MVTNCSQTLFLKLFNRITPLNQPNKTILDHISIKFKWISTFGSNATEKYTKIDPVAYSGPVTKEIFVYRETSPNLSSQLLLSSENDASEKNFKIYCLAPKILAHNSFWARRTINLKLVTFWTFFRIPYEVLFSKMKKNLQKSRQKFSKIHLNFSKLQIDLAPSSGGVWI